MEILFWLTAAVGVLVLALLLFWGRVLRLLHRPDLALATAVRRRDASEEEIATLRQLPPSPITRISFDDAMFSERFGSAIEQYCNDSLGIALSGDGLNVLVQSVLLSSNELNLVYKFSPAGTRLFEAGQASIPLHRESGRLLPLMRDRSGQFIEQAKGANMLAPRLAASWALVVSAAHLIAGVDVVKRLNEIDRNLSLLAQGRRIDQVSKLDRIYTESRSLLRGRIDTSVVQKLKTYRYETYELRKTWCREISHSLDSLNLPDRDWWHYSSWWLRKKREDEAITFLVPIAQNLEMLRVALLTDACLALASGTTEDFFENAVPSERSLWAHAIAELDRLKNHFRKDATRDQIKIISAGVDRYFGILEGFVGLKDPDDIQRLRGPSQSTR